MKKQRNEMVISELDTFADPPRFGDRAKGMAFGAPKSNASMSAKRVHAKTTNRSSQM